MTTLLDRSRDLIAIVLIGLAAALALALLGLILWRAVDEVRFLWRQRIIARYRPLIDALVTPTPGPETMRSSARVSATTSRRYCRPHFDGAPADNRRDRPPAS